MAESLPASPTERTPSGIEYRPISGLAVAAVVVSGFFITYLIATAGFGMWSRRATLNIFPLLIAGLGLVLAVAARAHIRRSEGTRDGMRVANTAWWTSVLGGAAYASYLLASILALRQQSEKVALEWFDLMKQQKFNHAFMMTIEPTRRQNVNPDNPTELDAQFGALQLPGYRNSEVVRFFQRNGDDVEVVPLGVGNWQQSDTGYRVESTFRLRAAEGSFNLNLVLIGAEGPNIVGREWFIMVPEGGMAATSRTTYGRLLMELGMEADKFAQGWIEMVTSKNSEEAYFATLPEEERPPLQALRNAKCAAGGLMVAHLPAGLSTLPADRRAKVAPEPDPAFAELMSRNFFQLEGVQFLTEDMKKKLRDTWKVQTILRAGATRLQNPDTTPQIAISANEIVYSFPVEIGLPGASITFSKGRVVVVSAVPELVKEMLELKAKGKANPDASDRTEEELKDSRPARKWRVVRLETNLEPLSMPQRPGGPAGPGGPGDPGAGPP